MDNNSLPRVKSNTKKCSICESVYLFVYRCYITSYKLISPCLCHKFFNDEDWYVQLFISIISVLFIITFGLSFLLTVILAILTSPIWIWCVAINSCVKYNKENRKKSITHTNDVNISIIKKESV